MMNQQMATSKGRNMKEDNHMASTGNPGNNYLLSATLLITTNNQHASIEMLI